jgi:hypothetical protein
MNQSKNAAFCLVTAALSWGCAGVVEGTDSEQGEQLGTVASQLNSTQL